MKTNLTKKNSLLVIAFLMTFIQLQAQAPAYQWLNQGYPAPGNFPPQVTAGCIALDALGNSYVTGSYVGRTVFGKGADTIPVTQNDQSSISNTYLAKYDNTGNVVWVKSGQISQHSSGYNYGAGVAIDASNNIYITGYFHDSVQLGGTLLTTVTTDGSGTFIAKYDPAGNVLWAKKAGTGDMYASGIAVDAGGNCYLEGQMAYTGTIAGSTFSNGFYVSKYDTNGNPIWAVGNEGNCFGKSIACSGTSVFVTGDYYYTPTFGSTTLTDPVAANLHFFLTKLDTAGTFIWAVGNPSTDIHTTSVGNSVTADNSGNCFVGGTYSSELKLGADVLTGTATQTNAFLVKFNNAGTEQWAKSFISSTGNANLISAVCADNAGNAFILGGFVPTTNFGVTTIGVLDGGFIAKYNSSGTNLWATYAGSHYSGGRYGRSIAADASGAVNFVGDFQYSETFGTLTINNPSFYPSMYIARLGNVTGTNDLAADLNEMHLFPNPTSDNFTVTLEKEVSDAQLNVVNLTGSLIFSEIIKNTKQISLTTNGWAPGIYFVKVSEGASVQTKKIIVSGK